MNRVIEILKEIGSISARTDKERIINENKDNELFVETLKFVFNDYIVTGLSAKKIKKKVTLNVNDEINSLGELFDYLKTNNTGTDKDIKVVQNFIEKQDEDLRETLENIATKNVKIGCTAKTINKVLGNIIPVFEVMLAEKLVENLDRIEGKKFIVTLKLDGNRVLCFRDENRVFMYSRSGQLLEGFEELEKEIMNKLPIDTVFDGELLLKNVSGLNSKDLFQETQKVIRKKGSKKDIEFHVFDMLPLEEFQSGKSIKGCLERKNELHELLEGIESDLIKEVKMIYIGDDIREAHKIMDELVDSGEEGIMVNLADAKYECKRVRHLLKGKKFLDADVRVIDVIEGTNKNKGKLGAIRVQFEVDGEICETNIGSGFSDHERELYYKSPELLIGKIVTVGYFEITQNAKSKDYGFRFGTWKGIIRDDKDEISMY